ncbi:MAG: hypothetical protein ACKVKP_12380 [Acidimicrobiales bacterium]
MQILLGFASSVISVSGGGENSLISESLLQLVAKIINSTVTKQRKMILELVLNRVIDTVSTRNLEHRL